MGASSPSCRLALHREARAIRVAWNHLGRKTRWRPGIGLLRQQATDPLDSCVIEQHPHVVPEHPGACQLIVESILRCPVDELIQYELSLRDSLRIVVYVRVSCGRCRQESNC